MGRYERTPSTMYLYCMTSIDMTSLGDPLVYMHSVFLAWPRHTTCLPCMRGCAGMPCGRRRYSVFARKTDVDVYERENANVRIVLGRVECSVTRPCARGRRRRGMVCRPDQRGGGLIRVHVFPAQFRATASLRGCRRAKKSRGLRGMVRAQRMHASRSWPCVSSSCAASRRASGVGRRRRAGRDGGRRPMSGRGLLAGGGRGRESRRGGHVRRRVRTQSAVINSSVHPGNSRAQLDPLLVAGLVVFSTPSTTCSISPPRREPQSGRSSGWPRAWPPPLSPSGPRRSPCLSSSPTPTSTTSASRTTLPSSATGPFFLEHTSHTRPSHPAQAQASPDAVRKDCVRSLGRPAQPRNRAWQELPQAPS